MLSITDLSYAYQTHKTSPSATLEAILDKITASDLNSFISIDPQTVLREARAADIAYLRNAPTGALCGIPIAVKDLIDVAGMRTTMGSEQYADQVAAHDAMVVQRLRAQGAIILGKTNTHEFAYGSTGDRSYFGAVLNPRNPAHMAGGSSSGSAAALGAGLCAGALGTDTSASIRLPAALCGVVGLKPTSGLLSRHGVFELSSSLDHVGPMSTTVRDNALLLDILTNSQQVSYADRIGQPVRGLTVGIADGPFFEDFLDDSVHQALEGAKEVFEQAGARVVSVRIPDIQAIYDAQQLVLKVEAYAHHLLPLKTGAPYQPEVRERLLTGSDVYAADYLQALAFRAMARQSFNSVLSDVDVIMCATCGIAAPLQNERISKLRGESYSTPWLLTRLTAPTNLSGHPSLSVPFGVMPQDLPLGIQLIAQHADEAALYQFAHILETGRKIRSGAPIQSDSLERT